MRVNLLQTDGVMLPGRKYYLPRIIFLQPGSRLTWIRLTVSEDLGRGYVDPDEAGREPWPLSGWGYRVGKVSGRRSN